MESFPGSLSMLDDERGVVLVNKSWGVDLNISVAFRVQSAIDLIVLL